MKTVTKILWQEVKINSWGLFLILILMLALVGLEALTPWPFELLIDHVLTPNPIDSASFVGKLLSNFNSREILGFFVVLIYFLSSFLLSIVEYFRSAVSQYVVKKLTSDFSKNAFKNLQALQIGFYNKQQIGDYIYRLSYDVYALGEFLESGLLPLLTSGFLVIVTTIVMFLIDVKLTLLSIAIFPLLVLGLYSFNTFIGRATEHMEFFNSAAFSFIEEALNHIKIIQAYSQEHSESLKFNEKIDTSLKADLLAYRLDFLLTLVVGILIAISYSVIIMSGIRAVFTGSLTTGLLIVFIFYLDNMTKPIVEMIYSITTMKQNYVKILRMEDFFTSKTHQNNEGRIRTITDTRIKFDHVTVKSDEGKNILHNLNFEIEPNKRTIIYGISGSGKTSVINLIMRFIDKPTSGKVYLGGVDINDYDLDILRKEIAYVPQEITLFNDTIYNNIIFGNPHATKAEVVKAARLAAADDFIKKLPGGYNFMVGESGNFLSGGQKQRLMIARALLKSNAKILLFDEVLSALDIKTRKTIIQNILSFSKGKTVILISNIFTLIGASDNVIVLDKGELLYSGPNRHLSKEASLYRMLIEQNNYET